MRHVLDKIRIPCQQDVGGKVLAKGGIVDVLDRGCPHAKITLNQGELICSEAVFHGWKIFVARKSSICLQLRP